VTNEAPSTHPSSNVPLLSSLNADEVLAFRGARLVEQDPQADGVHWFLFLSKSVVTGSQHHGYLDLGARSTRPTDDELEQILHEYGLATEDGWQTTRLRVADRVVSTARVATPAALEAWAEERRHDAAKVESERVKAAALALAERRVEAGWAVPLAALGSLFLVLAAGEMPAGYYEFLRYAVSVLAGLLVIITARGSLLGEMAALAVVLVLWNPLLPFYLSRDVWIPLDIAAAGFLGWVAWSSYVRSRQRDD
jgi:hypothetical protein